MNKTRPALLHCKVRDTIVLQKQQQKKQSRWQPVTNTQNENNSRRVTIAVKTWVVLWNREALHSACAVLPVDSLCLTEPDYLIVQSAGTERAVSGRITHFQ